MNNKLKYIVLSVLVVLITFTSCEDDLNINTDPFVATAADPNTVFPYVMVQYSNRKTTELGTRITDVSQHMSSNFNSPRRGNTSIFLIGNTWFMMYSQVLGNIELLRADAVEAGPSQSNVEAIALIWKAMIFYELTSLWGDVPFTQALNGSEFPSPAFDDQETVLRGCVTIIDDALLVLQTAKVEAQFDLSGADLWYGGDLDLWERYANTLKLRILMLIRNVDTSVDAQITAVLNQPLIEDNSQAAMLTYAGVAGAENAYHTIVTAFFGPSNETVGGIHAPAGPLYDLIATNGDPRYDLMVADAAGDHAGIGINPAFSDPTLAQYTDDVIRGDYPDIYGLPAEVSLYRAELALLGVTAENAQTLFDQGVRQALEFWGQDIPGAGATAGISDGDITTFIGSLPPVTLQAVHEQLYLEAFLRPVMAWNTVRRTGEPTMEAVPGTNITTILKRFDYPPDEIGSNPNTPANIPTDTPMWFENL